MNSGGEEYIQVSRAQWEHVIDLLAGGHEHDERVRQAAHEAGIRDGHQGWETGYTLGHDVGLCAAERPTQEYIAGIFAGLQDGGRTRREIAREQLHEVTPEHLRPGRDEPEQEIEHEAGA